MEDGGWGFSTLEYEATGYVDTAFEQLAAARQSCATVGPKRRQPKAQRGVFIHRGVYRGLDGQQYVGADSHAAKSKDDEFRNTSASERARAAIVDFLLHNPHRKQLWLDGQHDPSQLPYYSIAPQCVQYYDARVPSGRFRLYDWQVGALNVDCVAGHRCDAQAEGQGQGQGQGGAALTHRRNLLVSAPTSGGKSAIQTILALNTVCRWGLKALIVVPYASLAQQVTEEWRALCEGTQAGGPLSGLRLRVMAAFGNRGFHDVEGCDVAVCTIEKACAILNHELHATSTSCAAGGAGATAWVDLCRDVLIAQAHAAARSLTGPRAALVETSPAPVPVLPPLPPHPLRARLGLVVLDELHSVSEEGRGHLLESLVQKLLLAGGQGGTGQHQQLGQEGVQILGVSATLPNLPVLQAWLGASSGPLLHAAGVGPGAGVAGHGTGQQEQEEATAEEQRVGVGGPSCGLYVTTHRPVPVQEYVVVAGTVLNKQGEPVRVLCRRAPPLASSVAGRAPQGALPQQQRQPVTTGTGHLFQRNQAFDSLLLSLPVASSSDCAGPCLSPHAVSPALLTSCGGEGEGEAGGWEDTVVYGLQHTTGGSPERGIPPPPVVANVRPGAAPGRGLEAAANGQPRGQAQPHAGAGATQGATSNATQVAEFNPLAIGAPLPWHWPAPSAAPSSRLSADPRVQMLNSLHASHPVLAAVAAVTAVSAATDATSDGPAAALACMAPSNAGLYESACLPVHAEVGDHRDGSGHGSSPGVGTGGGSNTCASLSELVRLVAEPLCPLHALAPGSRQREAARSEPGVHGMRHSVLVFSPRKAETHRLASEVWRLLPLYAAGRRMMQAHDSDPAAHAARMALVQALRLSEGGGLEGEDETQGSGDGQAPSVLLPLPLLVTAGIAYHHAGKYLPLSCCCTV